MAWLRSKKALKHLRSHLGHIQVITECPAITDCPQQYHSIIKYLIPVFSTENPCSFALAHTRDSSSGHSGAQQPQTHLFKEQLEETGLVVRAFTRDYRRHRCNSSL